MHLIITLTLGLMLLQTGYALRCYECDLEGGITCTDQIKNCPNSSDKCLATTIRAYVDHRQVDGTAKKCVPDDKCANGSVGIKGAIVFSQCCITDLCNGFKPPVNATPNGLKCYACDDSNYCSHIVSCVANQDHCFSNTETDSEGKVENHVGCISKSICDDSCCEGDLCNDADFRAKRSGSTAVTLIITAILASLLLVL